MSMPTTLPPPERAATIPAADPAPPANDIAYLSPPAACQMADEWFDFAVEEHFWFQWRLAAIQALLGPRGVIEPALEVGCGNAASRNQIERAFDCEIAGCDLNAVPLQRARPGRGRLYCYDIRDRRPEWRRHFATILLLDTLEHIAEPAAFLASAAHHLHADGRILIAVPAQQWLYSRYDQVDGHVKRYSPRVLRRELAAAGLTLETYAYWGLSLIPVLALRKAIMWFCKPEQAIAVGFQPKATLVDHVLRGLMRTELTLSTHTPTGVSLVALARKREAV